MTFDVLQGILAEMFSVEEQSLSAETTFEELCADSYDFEELSFVLEEEFDVLCDGTEELVSLETVGDLVDYIDSHRG